jgi:hypothetical protein
VRNPNFDAAMAQQDYANLMRDQQARFAAERGGQAFPPAFGRPSTEPMINPETIKKARDEYIASQPKNPRYQDVMINSKYGGQFESSIGRGFDKWFETNYINNPNSALSEQERMSLRGITQGGGNQDFIDSGKFARDTRDRGPKLPPQLPQEGGGQRPSDRFVDYRGQRPQLPQEGGGNQDVVDFRRRIYDDLMARQGPQFGLGQIPDARFYNDPNAKNGSMAGQPLPPEQAPFTPTPQLPQGFQDEIQKRNALAGMGGKIPTPIPEAPQGQQAAMAAYNNFLQQGIQNSNTLNQGAMASFANTQPRMQVPQVPQAGAQIPQPGMQTPQAGIAKPQNPNMAGMVTRQRRPFPAPRKFSTLRNTPARFG